MNSAVIRYLATVLVCLATTGQASAVSIFTDRTAWLNALGAASVTEDTFSNNIAEAASITFDSGVVSTVNDPVGVDSPLYFNNDVFNGRYFNAVEDDKQTATDSIRWVFPFQIFAWGADFFSTDEDELQVSGNFDGAGVQEFFVKNQIGTGNFLGFIGNSLFSEITLFSASSDVDAFEVDNLAFARQAGAVPEPATLALLAFGLAGLGFSRRKQR